MKALLKRSAAAIGLLSVLVFVCAAYAAQPGAAARFRKAGDFDVGILNTVLVKARKESIKLKGALPVNAYRREGEARARKAYEFYESAAFQNRLARETERVKKEIFGNEIDSYYRGLHGAAGKKTGSEKRLTPDERIYLFISSSIPVPTLRTYTEQLAGLRDSNIVVVMRGFIDGMTKIGPTLGFTGKILAKNPACGPACGVNAVNVEVDPLLFKRYGITRVPAVVYVPDIEIESPGSEGLRRNAKVGIWYAFYGDAALSFQLDRINHAAKSASLAAVIKELKRGFYR